jgi:sugar phosphate isomerase/epimerase
MGGGKLAMPNAEFIAMAKRAGYDGVDIRASQLSHESPPKALEEVKDALKAARIEVAILGLKDAGEKGLAELPKVLQIAAELRCGLIRIGGDVEFIKRASDLAAPYGIRLGSQMHTGGEFETFALAEETLERIGRSNFGLITEPANSFMAGDAFTAENFRKVAPHIFASNIQSLIVVCPAETRTRLKLRSGKEIGYKRIPIQQNVAMNIPGYFATLRAVGFDGCVNMLEPVPEEKDVEKFAREYLVYLKKVAMG